MGAEAGEVGACSPERRGMLRGRAAQAAVLPGEVVKPSYYCQLETGGAEAPSSECPVQKVKAS